MAIPFKIETLLGVNTSIRYISVCGESPECACACMSMSTTHLKVSNIKSRILKKPFDSYLYILWITKEKLKFIRLHAMMIISENQNVFNLQIFIMEVKICTFMSIVYIEVYILFYFIFNLNLKEDLPLKHWFFFIIRNF